MKKKVLFIIAFMCLCVIFLPEKANAAYDFTGFNQKVAQLKNSYPEGTAWSNANTYGGAAGCWAFAKIMADNIFGSSPRSSSWGTTSIDNVLPGDIITTDTWNGSGWTYRHTMFVIGVDGNNITLAEGNYSGKIKWGRVTTRSAESYIVYHANNYDSVIPTYNPAPVAGPPAYISADKRVYNTTESISFSWPTVENATDYYVYMWKDGIELYATYMGSNTAFTSAPTSAGNYTFLVRAGNSAGYSDTSVQYKFTVTDSIPDAVKNLRSDKSVYSSNESITLMWDATYGVENYWIYLWKDGVELYYADMGQNTTFTSAPTSAGRYTLYIRPGNVNGFNENSTPYRFTVTDSIPDAVTNLRSDKSVYSPNESITFTWDATYGVENYWIYLWKDGVELYYADMGQNTTFTSAPVSTGRYTLYIRPGNVNGFNENSTPCSFVVGLYEIQYDANGGDGAPLPQSKIHGEILTLSTEKPSRTGYTFKEWNTKADGSGSPYSPGGSYADNLATTLYAQWVDNQFSISFIPNGGSGTMEPVIINENQPFTLPECGFLAPVGTRFKAWKIGDEEYQPGDKYTFLENKTVTAIWEALSVLQNLYNLGPLTVRDTSGDPLTAIPSAPFLVTVPITKQTGDNDAMVLIASYTASGQYRGLMYIAMKNVPTGGTAEFTFPVDNPDGDVAVLKAFCIPSFGDMTPVGPASVFPTT